MVPPSVASKPARQRSKVLFPEPFGPVTSIISPGPTVPETPCSTDNRPKRRRTWSNWSRGAFTGGNIQADPRKPPARAGGAHGALFSLFSRPVGGRLGEEGRGDEGF